MFPPARPDPHTHIRSIARPLAPLHSARTTARPYARPPARSLLPARLLACLKPARPGRPPVRPLELFPEGARSRPGKLARGRRAGWFPQRKPTQPWGRGNVIARPRARCPKVARLFGKTTTQLVAFALACQASGARFRENGERASKRAGEASGSSGGLGGGRAARGLVGRAVSRRAGAAGGGSGRPGERVCGRIGTPVGGWRQCVCCGGGGGGHVGGRSSGRGCGRAGPWYGVCKRSAGRAGGRSDGRLDGRQDGKCAAEPVVGRSERAGYAFAVATRLRGFPLEKPSSSLILRLLATLRTSARGKEAERANKRAGFGRTSGRAAGQGAAGGGRVSGRAGVRAGFKWKRVSDGAYGVGGGRARGNVYRNEAGGRAGERAGMRVSKQSVLGTRGEAVGRAARRAAGGHLGGRAESGRIGRARLRAGECASKHHLEEGGACER